MYCSIFQLQSIQSQKAIDWNYHIELPTATSNTGEMVVSRKFNPRTREWTLKAIKEKKGYESIPILTANILKLRTDDVHCRYNGQCLTECERPHQLLH